MKRKQPPKNKESESTDESGDESHQSEIQRKKTKTTRSNSKQIYEYKNGTLLVKEETFNKDYETFFDDFKQVLDQSVLIASEIDYKPTQFYIPQLGDDIVFIRDGYTSYCENVTKHNALPSFLKYFQTRQTPDGFKRDVTTFPPSIRCIVSRIEYKNIFIKELDNLISKAPTIPKTKPNRFNFFTISLVVKGIMTEEITNSTMSYSVNIGDTFNFDLFYYPDSKPFIITYGHYLKSVEYYRHISPKMSISMDFIDASPPSTSTYTGQITEIKSIPNEPNCLFETLGIIWDTSNEGEDISVWEIKEVEEEAKMVLPKIDATIETKVTEILINFSNSADYTTLPLIQKSPYPILYATVMGRLQSHFYRTMDALVSDLSHITKCVKQEMAKKNSMKAMLKFMGDVEKLLNTKKITDPDPGMANEIIVTITPPPPPTLLPQISNTTKEEQIEVKSKKVINSEDEATESSDSDKDIDIRRPQTPKDIVTEHLNPQPASFVFSEPPKEITVEESKNTATEVNLPVFLDIPKITKKTKPVETKPPSPILENHPTQVPEFNNLEVIHPIQHPSSNITTPSIPDIILPSIKKKEDKKLKREEKREDRKEKKEEKEKKEKKKEEKKERKEKKKERKEEKEKNEKKDEKKKDEKEKKEKKKSETEDKKKDLTVTIKIPQQIQPETDISCVKIPKRKKESAISETSTLEDTCNSLEINTIALPTVDNQPHIPQIDPIQEIIIQPTTFIEPLANEEVHSTEEIGGMDSDIYDSFPKVTQKPIAPSIKLGSKKLVVSCTLTENIFEIEERRDYNEITLNIQLENNRIKVILEKNPNFDPIEAEKRKIWTNRLNNHFKNVGTTSSSELISHVYGNISKKITKGMNLSLPIFSTVKAISVSREIIPVHISNQIPKQLFVNKHENIRFYQQKRHIIIDHLLKVPITHYQIHIIKEESNMMEDENQGKITFNIRCNTTESERIKFYSLFDKVVEARRVCKNSKALFHFPEPQKLYDLNENFGFMVDNDFDWFIEGFYFKERIGKNQSISPHGVYYIAEFVYMKNNTEIWIDCQ